MRVLLFLILLAFSACSSARAISVSASQIHTRAGEIRRLAGDLTPENVASVAPQIDAEAAAIQDSVGVIHREVTGVKDATPWWATLLQVGLWAVIVVAVMVLLWQTGIGQAMRAAVGLIPRRTKAEAQMAAAVLDPAQKESVREWVAARRASDPLFSAAFAAEQESHHAPSR